MKNFMRLLRADNLVALWVLGFFGSMVIQSFFQIKFAEGSNWPPAHGWQNEIAIWNLGLIIILLPAVRNINWSKKILPGLTVLSAFFCVNHIWALLSGDRSKSSNIAGAISNGVALAAALAFWGYSILQRKRGTSNLMKEITIGDIYITSDGGHLKGKHRVVVIRDTRGGVGGGILVKSMENGQESHVLNEQLGFYRPWEKFKDHLITALVSALVGAAIARLIK